MASIVVEPADQAPEKGLKTGALGLVSSVVIGVASTAPAYSLAATLGFVVVAIGLQAPIVTILAFVPMYFISIGYQETGPTRTAGRPSRGPPEPSRHAWVGWVDGEYLGRTSL